MTFSLFRRYLGPWHAILIALTFAVVQMTNAASVQMFDFIKRCTAPDDVLVFWKPRAMILFGERRSILRLAATDVLDGTASVVAISLHHISLPWETSNTELRKVIAAAPARFGLIFSNEDYRVYRILTDGKSPIVPSDCRPP
jgi:hypothetical protein